MKTLLFYLIIGVLLFVIYGSWDLSMTDYRQKDICPKILEIPACYIVLFSFVMVLISHVLQSGFKSMLLYYGFIAIPFLLALGGTITELSGTVICPRTPGGIPMCFISLGMCSLLILLKIAENKSL